ncbi:undecaprenyldiphospho-muramoylpentapeptide beta-N-acetylglucosaminyltransferase [Candidatus Protochlamydia phocaeensis]|uniref:undecaprenyldiphospho-muramoylpentapeptide beta-N-acetylglucosaminyltransferase n=1 Tax=Candidatus Protochlamydia phocaeensis TaxID=1414722 RepID=UPI000837D55B|nr:undecaprenyldiphospho-muramoylpentapeptide beta-N-acetylglucosaminyltransferase [Candidatus Protochlamydia phocaeensis]
MSKRILIAAGGTGGHIFPAQGLAQEIKRRIPSSSVLFVAGKLGSNKYFDRSLFPFKEVVSSPLLSKNPIRSLKGLFNLAKGLYQSIKIMKDFQPDTVVGFGSYYTVPTLLAAKLLRIPIVLHEANSIPGKANKWLAPFACKIGVHFPSTLSLLGKHAIEVGMPLREGYARGDIKREEALAYFKLSKEKAILLVFGGSQGAQAINALMKGCVADLKETSLQVIHLTGNELAVEELAVFYASHGIPATVRAFEANMHYAWSIADFFIGRAGASTIAEAMEFEVPGILIPYPYATDQHQDKNADFLVETVKGAVKCKEADLVAKELGRLIQLYSLKSYLEPMRQAIQAYKQRPNRLTLCELILNLK